ncbi:Hypothetical predicted protein [Scomber scombrus]|uniref:Uncharacterized protein n=1 Tax=Scomber scombrus TaxID=13677 RepID=A0AAV1MZS5_SCOSC
MRKQIMADERLRRRSALRLPPAILAVCQKLADRAAYRVGQHSVSEEMHAAASRAACELISTTSLPPFPSFSSSTWTLLDDNSRVLTFVSVNHFVDTVLKSAKRIQQIILTIPNSNTSEPIFTPNVKL